MDHNQKLPLYITRKFSHLTESSANKNQVKAVIKRFSEYTQTYEFVMKFNNNIEKTDESSINQEILTVDAIGEEVDQKERRRYVRKEMKCFNDMEIFQRSSDAV